MSYSRDSYTIASISSIDSVSLAYSSDSSNDVHQHTRKVARTVYDTVSREVPVVTRGYAKKPVTTYSTVKTPRYATVSSYDRGYNNGYNNRGYSSRGYGW